MKMVIINGGTRGNGNTVKVLKAVAEGFDDVAWFDLFSSDIKGCSGCLSCKKKEGCSIKDDMTTIYEAMADADAVVIGSPVYMCEETSCTKAFIERTYALIGNENQGEGRPIYVPKLKQGKSAVAIFLCGSPLGKWQFRSLAKNYQRHFKTLGFERWKVVILPKVHPGVDVANDTVAQKAIAKVRGFMVK